MYSYGEGIAVYKTSKVVLKFFHYSQLGRAVEVDSNENLT